MKIAGPFPQGTQRIARIAEVHAPDAFALESAIVPTGTVATPEPVSDAELASAFVGGDAPVAAHRATIKRAYASEPVAGEHKLLTVA